MAVRNVYDYTIDLDSDTAPARVLRMISPGSKVLEIGAGPGSITRHLINTIGCDVVALEIDTDAIAELMKYCSKVLVLDLDDPHWSRVVEERYGKFDYVVAADVLEHVYEPAQVLSGMVSLLNQSGSIVLSLPHVGHATILACLLDEDFDYRPWGLLDRTHIRFFGLKNIQALQERCGLAIEQAEFVIRAPTVTEFAERWTMLPGTLQAALESNPFSHVYQVVTRAVPTARAFQNLDLMQQPVASLERCDRQRRNPVELLRQANPQMTLNETAALGAEAVEALRVKAAAASADIRMIAFYLPQFHPIPENDLWWGKGFTEWTNVTKAQPLFGGHYQPHLPTDFGFYDLRLPDIIHKQVELAKLSGIDGFCYHYYWFSGKRLLEKPLNAMLADPTVDMPYCLCWANENWTRRWDASEEEILLAQRYLPNDDIDFIKSIEPHLRDPRYIRVNGLPLLVVYRPQHLPDAKKSATIWRDYCRSVGLGGVHIAAALTHGNWDYAQFEFDSGVEFPPHNMTQADLRHEIAFHEPFSGIVTEYSAVAEMYLGRNYGPYSRVFSGLFPSWDNTARRHQRACVVLNGTPENFEFWLAQTIEKTREHHVKGERLIFINAWNEWAEGCHLEPDRKYGHRFLEAILRARAGSLLTNWQHKGVPVIVTPDGIAPLYAPRNRFKKSRFSRAFGVIRQALRRLRGKKRP